jgi:hypothetical protein
LDLLSYVEFQRNYLTCVRTHKAALMTQKAFWNSLLRDNISFRDLQVRAEPWAGGVHALPVAALSAKYELRAHHTVLGLLVADADFAPCLLGCLQTNIQAMEAAEQRATTIYRRYGASPCCMQVAALHVGGDYKRSVCSFTAHFCRRRNRSTLKAASKYSLLNGLLQGHGALPRKWQGHEGGRCFGLP